MKKLLLPLLITAALAGCTTHSIKDQPVQNKVKKTCKYICTMDKDVCADKSGVCPKCGMTLVEKDTDQ